MLTTWITLSWVTLDLLIENKYLGQVLASSVANCGGFESNSTEPEQAEAEAILLGSRRNGECRVVWVMAKAWHVVTPTVSQSVQKSGPKLEGV